MAKRILYINANPKEKEDSHSQKVAQVFLDEYIKNHTDSIVEVINLYHDNIPLLDSEIFDAWSRQKYKEELTDSQQQKMKRMDEILQQFINSDIYLFASPLWNFGLPPLLKAYMDLVIVARKTFQYSENGPVGLLQNKLAVFVQASGGNVSRSHRNKLEHASNLMDVLFEFIGIKEHYKILVEGIALSLDNGKKIEEKKSQEARELANRL